MIEKRTLLIVVVLAVVAILVLAIGLIGPAISSGGSGFTSLFDKMTTKGNLTHTLVIQNGTYKAGDTIKVTDKIIAIETHNTQSTTLYFLYQGTKWVDEADGTSFHVLTDGGAISVEGALFHIHIGTDLSVAFNVGNSITLQSQVVSDSGYLVLGQDWVLVSV